MPKDDEDKDLSNEPIDSSNFLEEMRDLYKIDPDEAIARLEEAGYTEQDLEM